MYIAVIHGPNLNLLGTREPKQYGSMTLDGINQALRGIAKEMGVELSTFQSNGEGELVSHIQQEGAKASGILINPGAYTHTSVAIRDALLAVDKPTVEVHLTNTSAREEFRRHSLIGDIVVGRIMGLGAHSYQLGLHGLVQHLQETGT